MPAWPRQTNQEGKEFIDMHEVLLIRSENEPNVEGSGMTRLVEWNEGSLHKHTSFKRRNVKSVPSHSLHQVVSLISPTPLSGQ